MLNQMLNSREADFLAYMTAGVEPKQEDKLEFEILAAQILKATDQCNEHWDRISNVTWNEFTVLPSDFIIRGRKWTI